MINPPLTKEQFKEYIDFVHERHQTEEEFCDVLGKICEDGWGCVFSKYEAKMLKLLETIFCDSSSMLTYWYYELEMGRKWTLDSVEEADGTPIDISTVDKLYDYLVLEMNRSEKT